MDQYIIQTRRKIETENFRLYLKVIKSQTELNILLYFTWAERKLVHKNERLYNDTYYFMCIRNLFLHYFFELLAVKISND